MFAGLRLAYLQNTGKSGYPRLCTCRASLPAAAVNSRDQTRLRSLMLWGRDGHRHFLPPLGYSLSMSDCLTCWIDHRRYECCYCTDHKCFAKASDPGRTAELTITRFIGQLTSLKAAPDLFSDWISFKIECRPGHQQLIKDLDVSIAYCKTSVSFMDDLNSCFEWDESSIRGSFSIFF